MPQEKFDAQEQRRRAVEAAPPEVSDAQLVLQENARRFREESARLQAEQSAREQIQRDRQAWYTQQAQKESDLIRARIFAHCAQMEEEAKAARARAEAAMGPPSPSFRNEQLELEIAAGQRALAKHRGERVASAEKEIGKDSSPAVPGFKP